MMKTVHRIVWDDAYIAAAQRMVIDHQNWSLRIVYKWWAWWLPRIVTSWCQELMENPSRTAKALTSSRCAPSPRPLRPCS